MGMGKEENAFTKRCLLHQLGWTPRSLCLKIDRQRHLDKRRWLLRRLAPVHSRIINVAADKEEACTHDNTGIQHQFRSSVVCHALPVIAADNERGSGP